jgi:hypothetical protein
MNEPKQSHLNPFESQILKEIETGGNVPEYFCDHKTVDEFCEI